MNRMHIRSCFLALGIAGLLTMGLLIGLGSKSMQAAQEVGGFEALLPAVEPDQTTWPWNIEFVSRLGGACAAIAAADSWVYLSCGPELLTLDMSNPAQPRVAGKANLGDLIRSMQLADHYLYAAGGNAGLLVIDTQVPTRPFVAGHLGTPMPARTVAVSGNLAYVGVYAMDQQARLQIIDISTPLSPTEVAYLPMNYVGDIKIVGHYAYVADDEAGLRIIDISNPTSPAEVGVYDTPGFAVRVVVTGTHAYVNDWFSVYRVLDVSDPAHPTEVSSFVISDWPYGSIALGHYLYVGTAKGLQTWDISNPLSPTQVATLDSGGQWLNQIVAVDRYLYNVAPYKGL